MDRKDFLRHSGLLALGLSTKVLHQLWEKPVLITRIPTAEKKVLADIALNTAKSMGASYADIRIGRYLRQYILTREERVSDITNEESFGFGVRVLVNGTWGFAASNSVEKNSIVEITRKAVATAKANALLQTEPVKLAPVSAYGEVQWNTPISTNAFEVPIGEKVEKLIGLNQQAMRAGANFCQSNFYFVNEQKYFASTEGSYIEQDIHRCWPTFTVTSVDSKSGRFETRNSLFPPIGRGYEFIEEIDLMQEAREAAEDAKAKHSAESVKPGKYDMILHPSHLFLTIHESVGHPLELDRVLGYEANYAGTSFATLDKWRTKNFQYGSEKVNFIADKTQPHSLGACGYDDDGVKTKEWHLIKDGILVNYQAIRDQVHMLDEKESHGCCYADDWSSIPFQRMPNVSLEPSETPCSVNDIISDTEKGIYIKGRGSYSIDQQRYNFQFGGQLYYLIENGKITKMLKDVAYQSNTQEFWNACDKIADRSDYMLGGTFFDGKGEPSQVSAVSHGCSTSRFKDINVINTGRRI